MSPGEESIFSTSLPFISTPTFLFFFYLNTITFTLIIQGRTCYFL